ncbi:putative feruloyl esterase [Diplogelasinospora grovesii]|uniref:Carboxylic ester hydrolase n=1 Tax=Diplogelasinospora grovesii TaxID=303347 RepID=A0AAN6S000_9PEZI|nr:putative feruloyl esterase [Diplogelasinospora grovesii]
MIQAVLPSVAASPCLPANIPYPTLFGAEFLSLEANLVANYSKNVPIGYYVNHGAVNVTDVSFCNVTLSYTHPGQNDKVHVQVWLPTDTWNGRLQAIGGAGWQAGLHPAGLMGMTASIGEGYSTVSTDAGLGSETTPVNWGLLSPGNANLYLLQNLASVSLNDAAVIGKSITSSYYGQPPKYSYFNGCSQGGRQGLMLAQRYPDAFDGIAAAAPAINWNQFFVEDMYPSFLMDSLGAYPPSCEFNAITAAAIKACDAADGVVDGIITDEEACDFDPMSLVGTVINCTNFGAERPISSAAATIIQGAWSGAKKLDNSSIWFGVNKDAVLTGSQTDPAVIPTTCNSNGTCTRTSFELAADWIKLFILKNSSATVSNLTHEEFDRIAHASVQLYESIIGTNDPDLSAFRDRGGKMITYHGTTDSIITPRGSEHYYQAVMQTDPTVRSYYRLFLAPGINHCFGGPGAFPDTTFDAMRAWVEDGVAPDTLAATSVGTTPILKRSLCPYPQRQYYNGTGNSTAGEGFYCK